MNAIPRPSTPVDIIVPVYGGREATMRCLSSVLDNRQDTAHEVHVIDDGSPDTLLRHDLAALAAQGSIQLHTNPGNLGFVATVNRGMALHGDRDVVLLNSDTEVAGDWLDRLAAAVHAVPAVATATPLSNNATICSYPYPGWEGGVPGGLTLAQLDQLAAQAAGFELIDIPTGVGFCLYVRRAALDMVGPFDQVRFGRGYGEENDFCLRAAKAGFRNVLVPGVFVFHEGGVSFAGERLALQANARAMLVALHPDYEERVARFTASDPVLPVRLRLDVARMAHDPTQFDRIVAERRDATAAYRACLLAEALAPYQQHIEELGQLIDRERAAHRAERDQLGEALATLEREIGDLRRGLAQAEQLVVERDAELAAVTARLGEVTAQAHAHADELARLRATRLGRLAARWLSWQDQRNGGRLT